MKLRHLLLIIAAGLILTGCEGDEGPAGPAGNDGGAAYTYPGDVADANGAVGADEIVLLKLLDPEGRPVADIGSTMTIADGTYIMGSNLDATAAHLGLEALVGGMPLRAFLVDTDGQTVSPVTEGVFELVTMVTGSPEGRSLADYPAADIQALVTAAETALDDAGTDLSDPEAVRAQLLADIGGQLADLSGGSYSISPTASAVSVDPADVLTDIASFDVYLTDGAGEEWDIDGQGDIDDGSSDTYDGMFYLYVDGFTFPAQAATSATAKIEDDREVVLGPVVDLGGSGLDVTRKIYVPETGSFARFAEILVNNTASDITVDVMIDGNLGSDESTNAVHYSSNGNTEADAGDVWMTMKWDDDPTAGFFFPGATPAKSSDDIEYSWNDLVIPAGETVVLVHWGFQGSSRSPMEMADDLDQIEQDLPDEMVDGLSIAEAAAALFIHGPDNVIGEAGSVAPLATVNLENTTTLATAETTAASDGSFSCYLADTDVGNSVQVTASDGTDDTVTVAVP